MKGGKEKGSPSASSSYEHHNKGHLHETPAEENQEQQEVGSICCPNCSHKFEPTPEILVHLFNKFVGVKFEPSDQQLIEHLEVKINRAGDLKPDLLMDEFIATIQGDRGICYTHPEQLPGVTRDGTSRHFFHKSSKAYKTGTRKRRKIQSDKHCDFPETRWHKTGNTKPVICNGVQKGCKKILVLYADYGKGEKATKTNWVMHQYHLGGLDDENDGQFVVSKIFYQTQPRQPSEGKKNDVPYESHERGNNSEVPSEQRVQLVAREPIGYMQMPPHLNIQEPLPHVSPIPAFHLNVPKPPPPVSPMAPFHLNMPNVPYTPGCMVPPSIESILANTYQQNMLATNAYQLEQEQQFHGNAAASLEEIMKGCTSAVPKEETTDAHSHSDWGFFDNWQANNTQHPSGNP